VRVIRRNSWEQASNSQAIIYADDDDIGVRGSIDILGAICFVVADTET